VAVGKNIFSERQVRRGIEKEVRYPEGSLDLTQKKPCGNI